MKTKPRYPEKATSSLFAKSGDPQMIDSREKEGRVPVNALKQMLYESKDERRSRTHLTQLRKMREEAKLPTDTREQPIMGQFNFISRANSAWKLLSLWESDSEN